MGYKILAKKEICPNQYEIKIEAPYVVRNAKAGQFIIFRATENSERVPLTIADVDKEKGELTLVFMAVGYSTKQLAALNVGEEVHDVVGPLGQPTHIKKYGTVVCLAGGYGAAPCYLIAKAFKEAGRRERAEPALHPVPRLLQRRRRDLQEHPRVCAEPREPVLLRGHGGEGRRQPAHAEGLHLAHRALDAGPDEHRPRRVPRAARHADLDRRGHRLHARGLPQGRPGEVHAPVVRMVEFAVQRVRAQVPRRRHPVNP